MVPKLHHASHDARCLDPDFAERRLGLSFVVFESGGDRLGELLNHSRKRATELQVDLQAWWLEDAPLSNVRYPGFLVVGACCDLPAPK